MRHAVVAKHRLLPTERTDVIVHQIEHHLRHAAEDHFDSGEFPTLHIEHPYRIGDTDENVKWKCDRSLVWVALVLLTERFP